MSTVGGLLLIGLGVMLLAARVPGMLLMMAFASDDGRATRFRLVAIAVLALPILTIAGLCARRG